METQTFTIEKIYDAPASKVWKAITEPELIRQWYFEMPDFKPVPGWEFSFQSTAACENPSTHLCKVTEVIPGKKLSYSWRYEGYSGNSLVTFELFEMGKSTRLLLTHQGLETFPLELRMKKNFEAGWTYLIGTSLPEFLEKVPSETNSANI